MMSFLTDVDKQELSFSFDLDSTASLAYFSCVFNLLTQLLMFTFFGNPFLAKEPLRRNDFPPNLVFG